MRHGETNSHRYALNIMFFFQQRVITWFLDMVAYLAPTLVSQSVSYTVISISITSGWGGVNRPHKALPATASFEIDENWIFILLVVNFS